MTDTAAPGSGMVGVLATLDQPQNTRSFCLTTTTTGLSCLSGGRQRVDHGCFTLRGEQAHGGYICVPSMATEARIASARPFAMAACTPSTVTPQRLRSVEGEHAARRGVGVQAIGEPGLHAGVPVLERLRADRHLQGRRGIGGGVAGLRLDARQRDAGLLRLDDALEQVAKDRHVVGWAGAGLELADGYAGRGDEVRRGALLHVSSGCDQLDVDLASDLGLGVLPLGIGHGTSSPVHSSSLRLRSALLGSTSLYSRACTFAPSGSVISTRASWFCLQRMMPTVGLSSGSFTKRS